MEQEIKFYLYMGGIVTTILSSWFAIKYQSKRNQEDIDKISTLVNAGFKRLDTANNKIAELEIKSSHFLTRESIEKSHPTKTELELHLKQLHKSDEDINRDINTLKKEINHKLDKIMDILLSQSCSSGVKKI